MIDEQLHWFTHWVSEREKVRIAKLGGARPPWTNDPIIAKYRFCNVRRKDDRVSRWLIKNVLTAEIFHRVGPKAFMEFTAFCRWNNWPPSIGAVLERDLLRPSIDWGAVVRVLQDRKRRGEKVWTGAYVVYADAKTDKAEYVASVARAVGEMWDRLQTDTRIGYRQRVWETLTDIRGMGSFMAGQIVDDWTWTPLLWLSRDLYEWAPQGPGSLRGLNRIIGHPLTQSIIMNDWMAHLNACRRHIIETLGKDYRNLTAHDVQNCLCEFDKYMRVKNGEGKPRSTYQPETGYVV